MSEIPATAVGSHAAGEDVPGAFWFDADGAYLLFMCPCGCGEAGALKLRGKGPNPDERPSWLWDGNYERPTLTPSVQRNSGCRWHGFLQSGIWRSV